MRCFWENTWYLANSRLDILYLIGVCRFMEPRHNSLKPSSWHARQPAALLLDTMVTSFQTWANDSGSYSTHLIRAKVDKSQISSCWNDLSYDHLRQGGCWDCQNLRLQGSLHGLRQDYCFDNEKEGHGGPAVRMNLQYIHIYIYKYVYIYI